MCYSILYTGCAKIKKKLIPAPKGLNEPTKRAGATIKIA